MSAVAESFVDACSLFPGWSRRRVQDNCRAGRIPGATKIGNAWLIRQRDVERLVTSGAAGAPAVADAEADLRARGVL